MRLSRSFILRYTVAVLSIVLATGLRLLLNPLLGDLYPFATLFLAVLVTAWYGGFGPAVAASLLGAAAAARFLLSPTDSFAVHELEHQAGLGFYVVVGLAIAVLGGTIRAARDRAEADA